MGVLTQLRDAIGVKHAGGLGHPNAGRYGMLLKLFWMRRENEWLWGRPGPKPRGLFGKSPVMVIVDDICTDFVRIAADKFVSNFVQEMKLPQEKGPRKRRGGKHISKWDRWS